MEQSEVTNEEFARFVKATSYVTVAERPIDPNHSFQLCERRNKGETY
jgi:formylglycine-generating enzyme required for sulfatase activity